MATIYADPRFAPHHTFRSFVIVVLLAVAAFIAALLLAVENS